MHILHIDSSIRGTDSVSRQLTASIVASLTANCEASVTYRDLSGIPPETLAAEADGRSLSYVDEFLEADTIVIGAPMYNLGVPWRLKAWIEALAVPQKTFRYTASGPQGLAGGRHIIIAYACGGYHSGPTEDFVEPYLRAVFGLIGITRIDCVRAEGTRAAAGQLPQILEAAAMHITEITRQA